MNKKFKSSFFRAIGSITIFTLIFALAPLKIADAASLTTSKDTVTRLQVSTTADHTIVFTLPGSVDFDRAGQTDGFHIDFPATFSTGGTWATADFTFNDGTPRTIDAVAQGAGTIDCTVSAGANNVCIAIDTTNMIFTIKPSATYTASATGATITFTIDGTTSDGTFTNPAAVAATNVDFQMCDEIAACFSAFTTSHSSQIAYGVIDDDTVAVTATVNSTISFDLDTTAADTCGSTESAANYSVALGTITLTDTRVSGATDTINHICVDLDTNATGGAVVVVTNANGSNGLVSTSAPSDNINSADGSVADGTENYGLCIVSVSATSGTLDDEGGYDGDTCAANSETNNVQALTTTGENIFDTNGAPIAGGRGQIAVNASISGVTIAHSDYTDAITFIATGTF